MVWYGMVWYVLRVGVGFGVGVQVLNNYHVQFNSLND
jgi:hypothetical protein